MAVKGVKMTKYCPKMTKKDQKWPFLTFFRSETMGGSGPLCIISIFSKKLVFFNTIFLFFSSKMVVLKFFFTQNWVKLQKQTFVKSPRNCFFYFGVPISAPKTQSFENHANSERSFDFFARGWLCWNFFSQNEIFFLFLYRKKHS